MCVVTMSANSAKLCFGYIIVLCLVGHVFMGAPMAKFDEEKCGSLSLDDCFKNLQVFLRLTSLPFTSQSKDLNKLCEKSVSGYNCSQVLLENRDCLSDQNKELLPVFISMAQYTYYMLCGSGESAKGASLRTPFLENSDCLLKQQEGLKCCAQDTHVPDLPVLRILEESSKSLPERQISTCCPLSRYIQCASNVAMNCGEKAANFTEDFIRRAAGEQVQGVCQGVPNYPDPDAGTCPEPVPTCSNGFVFHLQNNLLIFTISVLVWRMHQY